MKNELTADRIPSAKQLGQLMKELLREKDAAVKTGDNLHFITDFYLIGICVHTGLRISEMSQLTWPEIHDEYLVVRKGKGGKVRSVYFGVLTKKLLDELRDLQSAAGLFTPSGGLFLGQRGVLKRWGLHDRFTYWKKRIGLPSRVTFQSLRHYYATYLLESGVSLAMLRDQLGHSSLTVTSKYCHHTKSAREKLQAVS